MISPKAKVSSIGCVHEEGGAACNDNSLATLLDVVNLCAEAHNGRGKRKGKAAAAGSAEGQGLANTKQGSNAADKVGNGTHAEPAAPRRERPPKVKTAYTRLATRARTLVSRIGYIPPPWWKEDSRYGCALAHSILHEGSFYSFSCVCQSVRQVAHGM